MLGESLLESVGVRLSRTRTVIVLPTASGAGPTSKTLPYPEKCLESLNGGSSNGADGRAHQEVVFFVTIGCIYL